MTKSQLEPDVDLRREQLERQRATYRTKLISFALAAAIAQAAAACDGGDRDSETRPNGAAPANESATRAPETRSGLSFPAALHTEQVRNLFEVEAAYGQYWRMTTLDRYDGESWTSTNPDGSEGGVTLSAPATLPQPGGDAHEADTLHQTFRILSDFDVALGLPMAQTAE